MTPSLIYRINEVVQMLSVSRATQPLKPADHHRNSVDL